MQMAVRSDNRIYEKSRITILPFINLYPSNLDTIYSALLFSQAELEKQDLGIGMVRFAQPLYNKSDAIVEASHEIDGIVVKL